MSPLVFLAIPVVVFVVGSAVLFMLSRVHRGDAVLRNAPADLRMVVPMVRDQRDAGWPVSSGTQNFRG